MASRGMTGKATENARRAAALSGFYFEVDQGADGPDAVDLHARTARFGSGSRRSVVAMSWRRSAGCLWPCSLVSLSICQGIAGNVAMAIASDLQWYLQVSRDSALSSLDGLSEYDMRRPMTPTGTNLLGVVKHLTGIELAYLGDSAGPHLFPCRGLMTDRSGTVPICGPPPTRAATT